MKYTTGHIEALRDRLGEYMRFFRGGSAPGRCMLCGSFLGGCPLCLIDECDDSIGAYSRSLTHDVRWNNDELEPYQRQAICDWYEEMIHRANERLKEAAQPERFEVMLTFENRIEFIQKGVIK